MIKILNPKEFIEALKLSHQSGDKAFQQFTNFLERFSQEDYNLDICHEIGGSEKFLGWSHYQDKSKQNAYCLYGGLLFDNDAKTWSSHT